MNFPNVKVQPHWRETLEAAAKVLPDHRWLCDAVDLGIRPETEEEICRSARRVAVLEGIVDSTNIGAIFRSATALGGAQDEGLTLHRVPDAAGTAAERAGLQARASTDESLRQAASSGRRESSTGSV